MLKRTQRHALGSLCFDKRRGKWQYFWYEDGRRRSRLIGSRSEYPTKATAWKAAESSRCQQQQNRQSETMAALIERYEIERMPSRHSTARVYRSFLNNHVIPKWGEVRIQDVQPRPVELWLRQLPLSPKSKTHVRSLMHALIEFAMFAGIVEIGRNPISLVQNRGASKRVRKSRSLTVEQFRALLAEVDEPFATMALLFVCLGLRISEALALQWADVNWLEGKLSIRRGIVAQHVDDCKTEGSAATFVLAEDMLERLKTWKQLSNFSAPDDWIFASPIKLGRLPYSYTGVRRIMADAAEAAGIGHLTTHAFRHTHRTWLNATGTPIATQKKLMRHSTITMTMDTYGTVFDGEMAAASRKVAQLAFSTNGTQTARESS